jgi:hypothetical protein
MVPCGIKRCPPTPFDINRLHHSSALSRQRSRVRVSSSPPFLGRDWLPAVTLNPKSNPSPVGGRQRQAENLEHGALRDILEDVTFRQIIPFRSSLHLVDISIFVAEDFRDRVGDFDPADLTRTIICYYKAIRWLDAYWKTLNECDSKFLNAERIAAGERETPTYR